MFLGYSVFGVFAYLALARYRFSMRVGVAIAVFLVPSIVLTVWLAKIGDKPPPDAVTITSEQAKNK